MSNRVRVCCMLSLLFLILVKPVSFAEEIIPKPTTPKPIKELLRGEVLLLSEAFKKLKIDVNEEQQNHPVLLTPQGDYFPIVSDWRGKAFFQDKNLRNCPVELIVQRRKGLPYIQVLMVFTADENGKRQYMDYWCDICSIPMYEIKPCDCCQQPIRLRFQNQDLPEYIVDPPDKKKVSDSSPSNK